jgi:hypothetical protein
MPGWTGFRELEIERKMPISNEYEVVQLARPARLYPGLYASAWLMLST